MLLLVGDIKMKVIQTIHLKKFNKGITCSWEMWIKSLGINFASSYLRKLRTAASIIGKYPRFHKVYTRREQIKNMLFLNKEIAQFWSTV